MTIFSCVRRESYVTLREISSREKLYVLPNTVAEFPRLTFTALGVTEEHVENSPLSLGQGKSHFSIF